jgi:putative endonuclease
MTNPKELGKKGEDLAKEFLINLNYSIIETNWRSGHLEIDIIAENASTIVFCEVKTRSSDKMGNPEDFVTIQKQRNMIKAANHFVLKKCINKEVRFDIISIIENRNGYKIQHIPDAFTPRW